MQGSNKAKRPKKHHDSALEVQAQQRAQRKSVGFSWKKLPMKILFWPDELDKLRHRRVGAWQLQPSTIRQDRERLTPSR